MISDTLSWVLNNWMTGWLGLFLYWLPLAVCVIGYTVRTFENYQKDIAKRSKYLKAKEVEEQTGRQVTMSDFYYPTDKIGSLIGRALVSIVPFANAWAATFDVSPKFFRRLFEIVEKIFDQPLVPRPEGTL